MASQDNRPEDDVASQINSRIEFTGQVGLYVDASKKAVIEGCADLIVMYSSDRETSDTVDDEEWRIVRRPSKLQILLSMALQTLT